MSGLTRKYDGERWVFGDEDPEKPGQYLYSRGEELERAFSSAICSVYPQLGNGESGLVQAPWNKV